MAKKLDMTCPINDTMTDEQKIQAMKKWELPDLEIDLTVEYGNKVLVPIQKAIREIPGLAEAMEETAPHDVMARIFFEPNLPVKELAEVNFSVEDIEWFKAETAKIGNSENDLQTLMSVLRDWDNLETITFFHSLGLFNKSQWIAKAASANDAKNADVRKQVELLF